MNKIWPPHFLSRGQYINKATAGLGKRKPIHTGKGIPFKSSWIWLQTHKLCLVVCGPWRISPGWFQVEKIPWHPLTTKLVPAPECFSDKGNSAQALITYFILSRHRIWNIIVFMFSQVLCTLYNTLHSFLSVGLSYFKTFLVSQAFIFFKIGFHLNRLIVNSVTPRTLNS